MSRVATSSSSDADDQVGRYRLVREIARGGMAEVFAATQVGAHGFEKRVVIKRILAEYSEDAQFLRMMLDEARISMLLSHPNIAQVLDFGEEGGRYFLVMEYVAGQSLATLSKHLRSLGERLGVLESCYVISQVLDGLAAAHGQRDDKGRPAHIIHRDVSPQNILLSYDGNVKLIDFGIARARDRLERTSVGTIKGKLRYLAPEMIDPVSFGVGHDYDHRVDVFAAGVVLFELLAGRHLFSGADERSVYRRITEEPLPDLVAEGNCGEELMAILRRALERHALRRYATAEGFAAALRAYVYRTDPGFHHRRVVDVLERSFPSEATERHRWGTGAGHGEEHAVREVALRTKVLGDASASAAMVEPGRSTRPDANRDGTRGSAGGVRPVAADDETAVQLAAPPRPVATTSGPAPSLPDLRGDPAGPVPDDEGPPLVGGPARAHRVESGGAGHRGYATVSVGMALIAAVAFSWFAAAPEEGPAPPPAPAEPTPATSQRVPLLVTVVPKEALVSCPDHLGESTVTVPAVLLVPAGSEVELEATAPGYRPLRHRVSVGVGEVPQRLELTLTPLPVAVELRLSPPDALVTFDGKPHEPGGHVEPLRPIRVEATAPHHRPWRDTLTPAVGETWQLAVELERDPPPPPLPVSPRQATPRTRVSNAPAAADGELVITTTPYWGRVTIDGKAEEDTTPLRVRLPAGRHRVEVSHPPLGLSRRFQVTIRAGTSVRRTVDFGPPP